MPIVLLPVLLAGAVASLAQLSRANKSVKHTDDVRLATAELMRTLVDAETAQRGYLATGDPRFLASYRRALEGWRPAFDRVAELTRDNPNQQARLATLATLIDHKLAEMRSTAQARDRGLHDGALAQLIANGEQLMERIRAVVDEMFGEETQLSITRQHERVQRARLVALTLMTLALAFATSILVMWLQRRRETRRATDAEAETLELRRLQEAHADLEALFDHVPVGLSFVDRQLRFRRINRLLAEQINGLPVEAHIGKTVGEVLPLLAALEPKLRQVLESGQLVDDEISGETPAHPGEERISHVAFFPVRDEDGAIVGVGNAVRDVTRERRLEREQRRIDDRFRALVRASGDIVWTTDADGRMRGPQPEWCAYTGQREEECQGDGWSQAIHPDDAAATLSAWRSAVERRSIFDSEHRLRRRDGVYRWFALRAVPMLDSDGGVREWVGLHRDIDDDKRAADERARLVAAVADERAFLRRVSSALPIGVAFVDRQSRAVTFANPALVDILGGVPETPLARALDGDAELRGAELAFEHPTRGARALRMSAVPLSDGHGEHPGALVVIEDITDEKASMRFAEQFIGILGHDLRNPLNAIHMAASHLAKKSDGASELRFAQRIVSSAQRMSNMVNQLLDLTRARLGGGIPIEPKTVELDDVITAVVDELRLVHPEREIRCRLERDVVGDWDPDRLAQVVSNLVGNALKYGDPSRPVEVQLGAVDDGAVVEVHSDGPPIDPELIPVIFDPYRRGEARGGRPQGLGLGLFISQQIVVAHGGRIEVRSTARHGTTFRITLPRLRSERLASADEPG